jgi:hypothetical protein
MRSARSAREGWADAADEHLGVARTGTCNDNTTDQHVFTRVAEAARADIRQLRECLLLQIIDPKQSDLFAVIAAANISVSGYQWVWKRRASASWARAEIGPSSQARTIV